jgi:hypothetical protein
MVLLMLNYTGIIGYKSLSFIFKIIENGVKMERELRALEILLRLVFYELNKNNAGVTHHKRRPLFSLTII